MAGTKEQKSSSTGFTREDASQADLWGLAELVDFSQDAQHGATTVRVTGTTDGVLSILDNGCGINRPALLCFCADHAVATSNQQAQDSFRGLVNGIAKLSKSALVFTREAQTASIAMLSRGGSPAQAPVLTWSIAEDGSLQAQSPADPESWNTLMSAIVDNGYLGDEPLLLGRLRGIRKTGTHIILLDLLHPEAFDFKTDPHDIMLANAGSCDQDQEHSHVSSNRRSLRAFLEVLYLQPRVKFELQGQDVVCRDPRSFLLKQKRQYGPFSPTTANAMPGAALLWLGSNANKVPSGFGGVSVYQRNRLVRVWNDFQPSELSQLDLATGLLGVATADCIPTATGSMDLAVESAAYQSFQQFLKDSIRQHCAALHEQATSIPLPPLPPLPPTRTPLNTDPAKEASFRVKRRKQSRPAPVFDHPSDSEASKEASWEADGQAVTPGVTSNKRRRVSPGHVGEVVTGSRRNDSVREPSRKEGSMEPWQQRCLQVVKQVCKPKSAFPFSKPVDIKAWGCLDYYDIIKNPMDFGTISTNLKEGRYSSPLQFLADCRQVFQNAYIYNASGSPVWRLAEVVQEMFESSWKSAVKDIPPELLNLPPRHQHTARITPHVALPTAPTLHLPSARPLQHAPVTHTPPHSLHLPSQHPIQHAPVTHTPPHSLHTPSQRPLQHVPVAEPGVMGRRHSEEENLDPKGQITLQSRVGGEGGGRELAASGKDNGPQAMEIQSPLNPPTIKEEPHGMPRHAPPQSSLPLQSTASSQAHLAPPNTTAPGPLLPSLPSNTSPHTTSLDQQATQHPHPQTHQHQPPTTHQPQPHTHQQSHPLPQQPTLSTTSPFFESWPAFKAAHKAPSAKPSHPSPPASTYPSTRPTNTTHPTHSTNPIQADPPVHNTTDQLRPPSATTSTVAPPSTSTSAHPDLTSTHATTPSIPPAEASTSPQHQTHPQAHLSPQHSHEQSFRQHPQDAPPQQHTSPHTPPHTSDQTGSSPATRSAELQAGEHTIAHHHQSQQEQEQGSEKEKKDGQQQEQQLPAPPADLPEPEALPETPPPPSDPNSTGGTTTSAAAPPLASSSPTSGTANTAATPAPTPSPPALADIRDLEASLAALDREKDRLQQQLDGVESRRQQAAQELAALRLLLPVARQ